MHLEWSVSRPACGDADLLDRIESGDEAALQELYLSYGRRLLSYAFRLTGSVDRAEEVVQDTLLAAWRATRSYRGDGSILAWLLGIARYQSLNAIRRKTLPTTSLDEIEQADREASLPDVRLEAREREQAVRSAVEALPAEQREALELVFYQGLSLAETAAVCRCPVGTVKSRLHAAKARLRKALSR